MTREEMAIKFCERLPDGTLSAAVNADFDALHLFRQRDEAFRRAARGPEGIPMIDKEGKVIA